jgi:hypothetical protein
MEKPFNNDEYFLGTVHNDVDFEGGACWNFTYVIKNTLYTEH